MKQPDQALQPVDITFFAEPTLKLAEKLLGCLLVKETEEGMTAGYIVETEAYRGPEDRAAHSFGGRRTKRTEMMFSEPGRIYTYVMHTHCLVNVVSAGIDEPEAVLIRALEPCLGIDIMRGRRPVDKEKNLTNGPGKLTKAMGITMADYGGSFVEKPLYISLGRQPGEIVKGKRIGIQNSGEARDYPWRFWEKDNPYVSR